MFKEDRNGHDQVQTAISIWLGVLNIVLFFDQRDVVLFKQGIRQHIHILCEGANDPNARYVKQMILDILDHKPVTVQYNDQAYLGVVMAANGYPGSYPKNLPLGNLDAVPNLLLHMGTKHDNGQWLSNGGRVLCVIGQGGTLAEAQRDAYNGVAQISAEGLFFRKDIGWQAI